jgi:hypothetical protein
MKYKVLFSTDETVGLKTVGSRGTLTLEGGVLSIDGDTQISIPVESLRDIELIRMHGTGRMLRIQHSGGTLHLSVIRFSLFRWFAMVNYLATGQLRDELAAQIPNRSLLTTEGTV